MKCLRAWKWSFEEGMVVHLTHFMAWHGWHHGVLRFFSASLLRVRVRVDVFVLMK